MDKYLTPEQLANRWSCSSNTVRNLISSGKLDAFRVGRKLLKIPTEAIKEYEDA
ncbi:helix-turn-helix domain-containing protein [Tropicimonas sp. TH_r6]|uniref:helix-turn-helix domain-containing protein n=1 Tax=Tropicimonas sp. TH_r6 TaxID=3082085 RepID=UPI002954B2ED|nr:helix-turn-helix domain-containing protein [Tropicimonas sp. TH_r6]MDV7145889.1 helix-turn-helix domain-containing protein [Tropicimonas sp. TH_r6]